MASTAPDAVAVANTSTAAEKPPDDKSKLKTFLGILTKTIGVADLASIRLSLPASLLEPTPNLEYWNYLDQPHTFVAIGDSDDELGRMLEVLRFWFTKDLKYVKGKPCKPYNSTLGEFFRCNWDIEENQPAISVIKTLPSSGSSIKSATSARPSSSSKNTENPIPGTPLRAKSKPIRVSYLTEQTSHHPPVSAFYVDCPEKGLSARGFDQIAAKFTGTSVRVTAGEHNLGIFIDVSKRNETYRLTHPCASLGGFLRGALNVTVGDACYVTCKESKIKTILHYLEEGWIGRTQNKVEGIVFRYDPENDDKIRIRDVPETDILARVSGNWKDKLYYSLGAKPVINILQDPSPTLLVDLGPLSVEPKLLPPASSQLPNESLKFWSGVTEAIKGRQFSRATSLKQEIEEKQREKARARDMDGAEWQPRFFTGALTPLGRPELTGDGREVLEKLQRGEWELAEKP
ncbi:hypothetical protein BJ878DRAFT_458259 [Calycina marina]|uniref:Oxysterol-binding protein n=1 Tax=Calycina marina TaxID=1763456 RepID=A0A9P7Z4K5_9HELO|nr:hypothetical protein BJ878DRAFT_458259 [Calycina marina]